MEIALANEANVTDFNGIITSPWARFPKGVAIKRMLDRELFTVDIVVHQGVRKGGPKRKGFAGAMMRAGNMHHHGARGVDVMVSVGDVESLVSVGDVESFQSPSRSQQEMLRKRSYSAHRAPACFRALRPSGSGPGAPSQGRDRVAAARQVPNKNAAR